MLWKPWFSEMTTVIFSFSWSAVTSSVGFIRYVPSPMSTYTSPSGWAMRTPRPAGHLVAHAGVAELEVAVARRRSRPTA